MPVAAIMHYECKSDDLLHEARPYDEAVALLAKPRDLAVSQNRLAEFEARLSSLQAQYAGLPAFQERLRRRGWFETCVVVAACPVTDANWGCPWPSPHGLLPQ